MSVLSPCEWEFPSAHVMGLRGPCRSSIRYRVMLCECKLGRRLSLSALSQVIRDIKVDVLGAIEVDDSALWRRQPEKLRSRLSGLTIEPPTRVQ